MQLLHRPDATLRCFVERKLVGSPATGSHVFDLFGVGECCRCNCGLATPTACTTNQICEGHRGVACAKAHPMPVVALLACNMNARAGRNASSCSTTSAPFPSVMARWQAGASAWVTGSGAISVPTSEFFCSAFVNTVQQCRQCTPEAHTPHVQSMYFRVLSAYTRETTRPEKR